VTADTKRERPGYPRRKPRRKYGYSDCIRNEAIFLFAVIVLPLAAVIVMGVGW